MREREKGRAQLWSIYFAVRSLDDPPEFLRRAEALLRTELSPDHGPDPPLSGHDGSPSLQLVR